VDIVPTGTANIASVRAALERLELDVAEARDAESIREADLVVLPGVGAFGAAADRLEVDGTVEALRERVLADRPLLAICVGMQLLGQSSEENPSATGLGIVELHFSAFPEAVVRPQMGWNLVTPPPDSAIASGPGHAYFANSFRATEAPGAVDETWWADHGGPFVAGFRRGALLACQFHPELSAAWGRGVLARWVDASTGPAGEVSGITGSAGSSC